MAIQPWIKRLIEGLDSRHLSEADILTVKALHPYGRGIYVVKNCHKDTSVTFKVPTTTPGATYKPGEVLLLGSVRGGRRREVIGLPPSGLGGAALFPPSHEDYEFSVLRIVGASPETLDAGSSSVDTYLIGVGFLEDPLDTFTAVVYDEVTGDVTADPLVTVDSATWVSDPVGAGLDLQDGQSAVLLTVSVSADAPKDYSISYLVERS